MRHIPNINHNKALNKLIDYANTTDNIWLQNQLQHLKQQIKTDTTKIVLPACDRVNNFDNNRFINCGTKAGHKCEVIK